ncbi:hypothetical protein LWI29_011058 [Acer saccharum]|uniref:50S ribosomal protein 5, chloroplastic n=1 Tax=Acer saccharum TaxID=4024 RepID=A0AA39VXE5_ACESA|nr:hypothetical protein LWI29_011058 [Acer saccharum]KAK1576165.1 hypothetical protein Q3G72_011434 [Acer saccharum]KAK1577243.1 hypothetical protein Q3G72_020114 [Acer saccharum]
MALPLLFFTPLSSSSSPRLSSVTAITASPISRLHMKPIDPVLKSWDRVGVITNKRCSRTVKAFSDTGGPDGGESQSESDDEVDFPFDKLPLDSKLQMKLEQKMRMKSSKKIRLRRKKLVHKRRLRKRGQWPPSKVNKLKNV